MMKNYKGVLYGAVIYSVIIGLIYVALSLLGLLSRWCVIDARGSPLIYMLYLLYFRVESCEATIQWEFLDIVSGVTAGMPDETKTVERTLIIFIVYLALHASLVFISLYALCGVNNSCLGRRSFAIFFMPWILVWIAIIALDLTATTYYTIDAVNVRTAEGLAELLEITNPQTVIPIFETQLRNETRYFPPIIMALTAAKLFLFLLFNIVWVVAISRAGYAASTYHKYVDNSRRNYENNLGTQNPAFDAYDPKNPSRSYASSDHRSSVSHELPITTSAPSETIESRYNDTTRVQGFAYVHNVPQNNKQAAVADEEINFRIQRPNTIDRPQSTIQVQHYERTTYRTEPVDDEIENRLSRFQESNGLVIRTVEPLKLDDIPEQQKSIIGVRVLPPVAVTRSQSDLKPKPIPPPKPNNNRYSMQPMMEYDEPVLYRPQERPTNPPKLDRNSSSIKPVPAELRNQFAFNYLNPNNQVPKRAFQNLSEDEDSPAVPVPDYTLHFPPNNRRRTNLNSSSEEDYSSQYSQQNQQRY